MNKKITILIPTYNRPNYLRRILDYYSKYGKEYKIIIADSSSDENKSLNRKTILGFPALSITHLKYPKMDMYIKVAQVSSRIKTKYCVICADDDFITPTGINQSIDFLEENPDFTVAHGYYIVFWINGKEFCWVPSAYSHKSITFQNPADRLTEHLSDYRQLTFYGVHRTDFLKMISKETLEFTDDVWFGELFPSMLTLIHGKMKCLDVLYAARQAIPDSGTYTSKAFGEFIRRGTYAKKYGLFRDSLVLHLKKSGLGIEESEKIVDNAMPDLQALTNMKPSFKKVMLSRVRKVLSYLPDWAYVNIRTAYRLMFDREFLRKAKLYGDVISNCQKDFDEIREIVLKHG